MVAWTCAAGTPGRLPGAREQQLGHQLMISFWAWGDSQSEVMGNLKRVLENLSHALEALTTAS
mgnify:CR=1 FL=1